MTEGGTAVRTSLALALVGLLAAGGVALLVLAGWTTLTADSSCEAIGSHVSGMRGFREQNGITGAGSEWIAVLTDGVTEADRPGQVDIARAVRNDPGGYLRFRRALPSDTARVADRLRAVALDADVSLGVRAGEAVRRDVSLLRVYGMDRCGLV